MIGILYCLNFRGLEIIAIASHSRLTSVSYTNKYTHAQISAASSRSLAINATVFACQMIRVAKEAVQKRNQ